MSQETKPLRPLTVELLKALMLDIWPSPATCMDFGIETTKHLGALRHAYLYDEVPDERFDAALGKGAEIQKLVSETNPYRDAKFVTVWDELPPPDYEWEEEDES